MEGHPKNRNKATRATRKVKTIAGRLVRELEGKLPENHLHVHSLALFNRILEQQRNSKNKVCSLHEPGVHCISKGKEHKKYEYGNKVSLLYTQTTGVIVGALAFGSPYDGHTLDNALEQYKRLKEKVPKNVYADRGYKGKTQIGNARIHIPQPFSRKLTRYQQQKQKKAHRRRAAIEPVIGHLKQDHRLSRNFYKGDFGDAINVLLAAAAFNVKRMMNRYREKWSLLWTQIKALFFSLPNIMPLFKG